MARISKKVVEIRGIAYWRMALWRWRAWLRLPQARIFDSAPVLGIGTFILEKKLQTRWKWLHCPVNSLFGGIWLKTSFRLKMIKIFRERILFFCFSYPFTFDPTPKWDKRLHLFGHSMWEKQRKIWRHQKTFFPSKLRNSEMA